MSVILVFGISGCDTDGFLRTIQSEGRGRYIFRIAAQGWEQPLEVRQLRAELETRLKAASQTIKSKPGTSLVALHATNLAEAFIYSAIPLNALQSLNPKFCVTIFDDLYALQARLRTRGYRYSYRDLILWLRAELLMADWIADQIVASDTRIKNFLLGVKHSKSTTLRLLGGAAPKVYAAYSITGIVRERSASLKRKLLKETIAYRQKLHDYRAVVFDPGTLDDRIVVNKIISDEQPRPGQVIIAKSERWPYVIGTGSYAPTVKDPKNAFPIKIPHVEAFVLKTTPDSVHRPYSDIDALITQVDLHYVSQADIITVWRPFCGGRKSIGCIREVRTAVSLGKTVLAYCPKEDLASLEKESRPLQDIWPHGVPLIDEATEFWFQVRHALESMRRPGAGEHSGLG